jgi:glycosyltransferase involved in cell wall biosynthesis
MLEKQKKDISVIIPCFNAGSYLTEAIASVENSGGGFRYEVIVVNDGSTDDITIALLDQLNAGNVNVLHQENKGPAAARNTGIRASVSEYILFLDSDNKVKPHFISQALGILDTNDQIDIVYGRPEFFGTVTGYKGFTTGPYDLNKLWYENYIDMCSILRRSVLDNIGLLDEEPILIGHEDWEFWIRAGIEQKHFYFIDEPVFEYRLSPNSLLTTELVKNKYEKMYTYVYGKNHRYFQRLMEISSKDKNSPLRTFFKNMYHTYLSKKA